MISLKCYSTALIVLVAASAVAAGEQTAVEVSKSGDWIVHQSAGDGPKICFAVASPKLREPAGANRAKTLLYVSMWPKQGVKSEVSIKLGYQIKSGTEVAVSVGTDTFRLFGKEDRAYIANPTEELKLIAAMKSGQKLVVRATSERGTATTDTYSLAGLGQAMQAMAAACP